MTVHSVTPTPAKLEESEGEGAIASEYDWRYVMGGLVVQRQKNLPLIDT